MNRNLIDYCIGKLQTSEFYFKNDKEIEVRNAVVFYTNFAGKPNQFGNATKNFNLAINEEVKNTLESDPSRKWNIHTVLDEETQEPVLYYINVKINMDNAYPPNIKLFTEYKGYRKTTTLDAETIGCLDGIAAESYDCTLNIYESKIRPGHVTAYLRKLYVMQIKEPEFGGKYDDWEDPAPLALPMNGDPSIIDADVIDDPGVK